MTLGQPPEPPVFEARAVSKVYPMGEVAVRALREVDLDPAPGELMVLLGASGSGKSTLLNILGGLDVPTSGTVRYLDHDLTAATEQELTLYRREHVGFVFQFYNLIPSLTARENVALVTDIASAPMPPEEALALVGLGDQLDHFPAQLSGGEQQRVAIARAIAKRPQGDQADRELERAQNLWKGGAASEEAAEQARLAATAAARDIEGGEALLQAAEAEVAAARAALMGASPSEPGGAAVEVRASASGLVLRVLQQSARVVPAGTPLVEVGDAAGLEVVVDVLSEDAVKIQPGNPVTIDQWGGDAVLEGRVRLVEPEAFTKTSALGVEEQRVNVLVDLIAPPASLGAGYRLEAHIVIWSGEDVLGAPTSALFQHDGGWAAFAVENGRARRRAVRIGHRATEAAEILEGLSEGDEVILYPSALIADGVRVRGVPD